MPTREERVAQLVRNIKKMAAHSRLKVMKQWLKENS